MGKVKKHSKGSKHHGKRRGSFKNVSKFKVFPYSVLILLPESKVPNEGTRNSSLENEAVGTVSNLKYNYFNALFSSSQNESGIAILSQLRS